MTTLKLEKRKVLRDMSDVQTSPDGTYQTCMITLRPIIADDEEIEEDETVFNYEFWERFRQSHGLMQTLTEEPGWTQWKRIPMPPEE